MGDVIRLRADFGVELRTAQDQVHQAEHTIARARDAVEEIAGQLARLDPPGLLLDAAEEIESLQERLGAVEKAELDRGKLEGFQNDAEHAAQADPPRAGPHDRYG